ncbi:MAG: hypothetical protein F4Z55_16190 [Boseongicola sp. SB0667_bin_21]|nr:hypothetical protein [Boseongicola sp. SB0667_bin_21]
MTGRAKPPRHLSISATDAEWDTVRDHAARRGQTVARYVVGLVERDGRERDGSAPVLALAPAEQREMLEAVREIRTLVAGGRDAASLVADMQTRIAAMFATWAADMLDAGRADELRARLAAVRGESAARADMARLTRNRAPLADARTGTAAAAAVRPDGEAAPATGGRSPRGGQHGGSAG